MASTFCSWLRLLTESSSLRPHESLSHEHAQDPENAPPAGLSYLDVVVLGASHHQVVLAGGLGDREAHHGAGVAGQLAHGLEPVLGEARAGAGGQGDPGRGWGLPSTNSLAGVLASPQQELQPGDTGDGDAAAALLAPGSRPSQDLRTPGHAPAPARRARTC